MVETSEWAKVRAALANPEWDFRTVQGIARETGLDPQNVERLIDQHRSEIRLTLSRDRRIIYTLRSRPVKVREVLADIQRFIARSY
jgi:hypothetical protein